MSLISSAKNERSIFISHNSSLEKKNSPLFKQVIVPQIDVFTVALCFGKFSRVV